VNALLLILFALAVCMAARAADWSWQPAVEWRVDHQSNRLLSATREDSGEAGWLSLDAGVQRNTENLQLSLQPHFELQRFANNRSLDAEDSALQLGGRWSREYSQLSASAEVSRESTFTTELAETGIVDVNTRRELRNANLDWRQYLTSQATLDIQGGFMDVDYPNGLNAGLVGYRYPNTSLQLTRQFSSYTSFNVAVFGGWLDAPQALTTSRDVGVQAGATYALSSALNLELSAGLSDTRRSNPFETRSDRSQIWSAKLSRTFELGQWNFSLKRDITPDGRGVLARRDELAGGISREFAPRFTSSFTLHAIRNAEHAVRFFAADDYRYLSAETGLDRNLAQDWVLGIHLGATGAQRQSGDTNVHGWYTVLVLRWAPATRPLENRVWP